MGTRKMFLFNTHYNLMNRGSSNDFLYRKMALFLGSFWFSIRTFISRYLFRLQVDDNLNCSTVLSQEENQVVSNCKEREAEPEVIEFENSEYDGFDEKETPKFSFKFQFQNVEDISRINGEAEASVRKEETVPTTSTSMCQFMPVKGISGFMEESNTMSFTVNELYMDNNSYLNTKEFHKSQFLSEKDFEIEKANSETDLVHEEVPENSIDEISLWGKEDLTDEIKLLSEKDFEIEKANSETDSVHEEVPENSIDEISLWGKEDLADEIKLLSEKDFEIEKANSETDSVHEEVPENSIEKEQLLLLENNLWGKEDSTDEIKLLSENDLLDSPELISVSDGYSVRSLLIDSTSDEFLSEKDFGEKSASVISMEFDEEDVELAKDILSCDILNTETIIMGEGSSSFQNHLGHELEDDHELDIESIEEELHNSKESFLQNSRAMEAEIRGNQYFGGEDQELMDGLEKIEEPDLQNPMVSDFEESNELETQWEHQDLIEQLKDELRKVRATGLPTILEESESPKITDDLKPWKIDEKFQHQDRIDELHKFYKSYKERMRKFDILNYQKMYAIGFLQSKDPLQSISSRKSSSPVMTSLRLKNLWKWKRQRPEDDPMMKFVRELQSDLEMVYVGQLCLSWEFLYWQYGRAKELQESDPQEFRQYNQVAGEFQQFQVLLQRFLENEPFQGPRVENYIKNRCVLRNLLQVPVIREDSMKEKKNRRRTIDEGISSAMLIDIIEESMRTFWEFLRADKDETHVIIKGLRGTQVELQDPADSELLMEIRTNLQKKEKKLKDILRSGNCLVKKFQKHHQGDRSNQTLYFFSQVDVRLVARVINMSRITTDQLVWCHKKLNKISFVDRRIHLEPSFLLFPC